jgi:hypothetical protein
MLILLQLFYIYIAAAFTQLDLTSKQTKAKKKLFLAGTSHKDWPIGCN